MKVIKRLFTLLCFVCLALSVKAQAILPVEVDETIFNDNSVFISKDKVTWEGSDGIRSDDGWGAFTMQLGSAPANYSWECSSNKYGKNREMGIQESADNENWTDLFVGNPPTDWTAQSGMLKPDTRYIRFWYSADYKFGDVWFKYAYLRNIKIEKALSCDTDTLSLKTGVGNTATAEINFTVKNLSGDIIFASGNPTVKVSPERVSRDEAIAQQNITVTVSYTPETEEEFVSEITATDEGCQTNNLSVVFNGGIKIAAPQIGEATDITSTSFVANWTGNEGQTYLVTVMQGENVVGEYSDYVCTENSLLVDGLTPATTYTYYVKGQAGNNISDQSETMEVTTLSPAVSCTDIQEFVTTSGASVSQDMTVTGENLTSDITVSLMYGDNFSIDTDTISKDYGQSTVRITYSPATVGTHTDTLTVSTSYAEDIRIALKGTNTLPAPKALEAENVTNSSFTARWEKVEGADDYRLTVAVDGGDILPQYDAVSTGDVTEFEVTNLMPSSTYIYYVNAASGESVSEEASDAISVTTADGAVITYSPAMKDFVTESNSMLSQSINVTGTNIFDNINVNVSGSEYFTTDLNTLPKEGGLLTVTYSPSAVGTHTATLTLSTVGAENVAIQLNGTSTPQQAQATAAENIKTDGFTAKWAATEGADSYLLTVYKGDNALSNYNGVNTGNATSYEVSGLEEATSYNYEVKAVVAGIEGKASERISVSTLFAPAVSVISEYVKSVTVQWNEPYKADKYIVTLKKDGIALDNYNGIEVTGNVYTFDGLEPATQYSCVVEAVFGDTKVASQEVTATTSAKEVYGNQLNNMGFENWEGEGNTYEPVDWNCFGTGTGSFKDLAIQFGGIHMEESADVRPGTTGTKSVRIWTANVFGVKANGNLTTGRINAGSMTATDPENYNFTDINDEAFSEKIGARPDSLTVWVKYTSTNAESMARVAAIIHDNYSYRDPSESDPESANHVVANAELNFLSNGGGWQRLSIPFNYKGNQLSPDFMLVSFTSNMNPGGGDANDAIIIDDMHIVYKPSLSVNIPAKTTYNPGETISVNYELTGSMSVPNLNVADNTVSLQLSDSNGSFDNATTLTTITSDKSGMLTATLPSDLALGNGYRLRVVTTNYPMTAEANGTITVAEANKPVITCEGNTEFTTEFGKSNAKNEFTVTGKDLTGEIFASIDSKVFSVSPAVLPVNGGKVTVTYSPLVVGEDNAELVLKSEGAEEVRVQLHGTATFSSYIESVTENSSSVSVYPNPVQDVANVQGTEPDAPYCIYSLDGRMVKAGRLNYSTVNVSDLAQGTYFIVVENNKIKFIK